MIDSAVCIKTIYIKSGASEKAEAIMEKHHNWLSAELDRKLFFDALVNPPAPNKKLKQAMRKHAEFKSKK